MEATGGAGEGGPHRAGIGDVPSDHLDARIDVFGLSGGKIVQSTHPVTGAEQGVAEMRANEAGGAGNGVEGQGSGPLQTMAFVSRNTSGVQSDRT